LILPDGYSECQEKSGFLTTLLRCSTTQDRQIAPSFVKNFAVASGLKLAQRRGLAKSGLVAGTIFRIKNRGYGDLMIYDF